MSDGHDLSGEHEHCGCCGSCWRWLQTEFCSRCRSLQGHLGPMPLAPWDRTYQAVHGEPCPLTRLRAGEVITDRERFLLGVIASLYDWDGWYLDDQAPEVLDCLVADFGWKREPTA